MFVNSVGGELLLLILMLVKIALDMGCGGVACYFLKLTNSPCWHNYVCVKSKYPEVGSEKPLASKSCFVKN